MVRSATDAVKAAMSQTANKVGTCQMATRLWFDAPSVGDQDGDGDADAVDGWKSEPVAARHTDRKPPRGAPVAWSGGSKGYGHRALSLGPDAHGVYMIRTTDGNGQGVVYTRPLRWVEDTWGLTYLGWSETMSGQPIPGLVRDEPTKPHPKAARTGVLLARARAITATRLLEAAAHRLSKSKDPALIDARRAFLAAAATVRAALTKMPKK